MRGKMIVHKLRLGVMINVSEQLLRSSPVCIQPCFVFVIDHTWAGTRLPSLQWLAKQRGSECMSLNNMHVGRCCRRRQRRSVRTALIGMFDWPQIVRLGLHGVLEARSQPCAAWGAHSLAPARSWTGGRPLHARPRPSTTLARPNCAAAGGETASGGRGERIRTLS